MISRTKGGASNFPSQSSKDYAKRPLTPDSEKGNSDPKPWQLIITQRHRHRLNRIHARGPSLVISGDRRFCCRCNSPFYSCLLSCLAFE